MDQRLRDRALAALARNARGFSPLDAMGKALTIGKITYDMHRDPTYQGQNNPRDAARQERRRAMEAMRDMDQHNNAVGRQAAAEGRSVDPRDLQMGPWDRPPAGR